MTYLETEDANTARRIVAAHMSIGVNTLGSLLVRKITAALGAARLNNICWHCGVVLLDAPRPRCEQCPDECDTEGRVQPGCLVTEL